MSIRSFVLRQGRLTTAQMKALDEYWTDFGIDLPEAVRTLNWQDFFAKPYERIVLEIGFGNGESLLEMAKNAPNTAFVGVEVHSPGVGRLLHRLKEEGAENVRIVRDDAMKVLRDFSADHSWDRVQIYFPDPWPKARHHKRRLVSAPFAKLLSKKLRIGGEIHCATDWEHYAFWMRDIFLPKTRIWKNLGDSEGFCPRPEFRPQTKFEQRGMNKGHGTWDLRYQLLQEDMGEDNEE